MKTIIVKNQKEFDKIKDTFEGRIEIVGALERINRCIPKAEICVFGFATIKYVYGSATIKSVFDFATIESVSDSATIESVYDFATIKSVYGSATIESVSDSATIESVSDSATIKSVFGSATIESVYDFATIKYVFGSATIKYVYGSTTIKSVSDSATIKSVFGSATIKYVFGSATIGLMFGLAVVLFVSGTAKVTTKGRNIVRHYKSERNITLSLSKETTHIIMPKIEMNLREYQIQYPHETKGSKLILYKSVHKKDGRYSSENTRDFEYKIGETYTEKVVKNGESCGQGLHVAHKKWAIDFGKGWEDEALLECEVDKKGIYVAPDCDGKIRAPKIKIVREVPKEEW